MKPIRFEELDWSEKRRVSLMWSKKDVCLEFKEGKFVAVLTSKKDGKDSAYLIEVTPDQLREEVLESMKGVGLKTLKKSRVESPSKARLAREADDYHNRTNTISKASKADKLSMLEQEEQEALANTPDPPPPKSQLERLGSRQLLSKLSGLRRGLRSGVDH